MSWLLLAVVAAVGFSVPAAADSGVKGTIKDELGAAIGNAKVVVNAADRTLFTPTGDHGEFSLGVPIDGRYGVLVSAPGFKLKRLSIQIKKHRWVRLKLTLHPDPLVIKLYGDTFDTNAPRTHRQ